MITRLLIKLAVFGATFSRMVRGVPDWSDCSDNFYGVVFWAHNCWWKSPNNEFDLEKKFLLRNFCSKTTKKFIQQLACEFHVSAPNFYLNNQNLNQKKRKSNNIAEPNTGRSFSGTSSIAFSACARVRILETWRNIVSQKWVPKISMIIDNARFWEPTFLTLIFLAFN